MKDIFKRFFSECEVKTNLYSEYESNGFTSVWDACKTYHRIPKEEKLWKLPPIQWDNCPSYHLTWTVISRYKCEVTVSRKKEASTFMVEYSLDRRMVEIKTITEKVDNLCGYEGSYLEGCLYESWK